MGTILEKKIFRSYWKQQKMEGGGSSSASTAKTEEEQQKEQKGPSLDADNGRNLMRVVNGGATISSRGLRCCGRDKFDADNDGNLRRVINGS